MEHDRFGELRNGGESRAEHLAALEALFAKKVETPAPPPSSPRREVKLVTGPARKSSEDVATAARRERLLARLLGAEGASAVARAFDEMWRGGFPPPVDQDVQRKLLDHPDEDRVRDALASLSQLLDTEAPRRRAVLDARLRKLEEQADETSTRDASRELRKKLAGISPRR